MDEHHEKQTPAPKKDVATKAEAQKGPAPAVEKPKAAEAEKPKAKPAAQPAVAKKLYNDGEVHDFVQQVLSSSSFMQ